MKRRHYLISILLTVCAVANVPAALAFEFSPGYVVSDAELTDADSMTLEEIQAFLDAYGTLGERTFLDVDGKKKGAAQIIRDAAVRNGVNPRVILVMLQKEQSLVEDTEPTADQLDWAMGYGICDDCNHDTPSAQRFRGFAKQINSATLQLTEGYLADLAKYGETSMGFGPGMVADVDDETVVFANAATAALYTYTPHLHGNANFARLWQKWFTHEYPDGTLLQNAEDGGVWLLRAGRRRPITSRAALLSRFPGTPIVAIGATALAAYPEGKAIALPNYSLLRSPRGTVYLLVDDVRRGIASQEAFRAIGFNPEEILDVSFEDLDAYEEGEPITTDTVYPQGALLQDTTTGGVYFVQNGRKAPIASREILNARFPNASLIPATPDELALYPTAAPLPFPDGTIVATEGEPAVYVISAGERRPIANEETFLSYGWDWSQVVRTNARAISVHPLGEIVSTAASDREPASL